VAAASIAVAEARALSTEISLAAGSTLFELAGSQATLAEHGLDRHWRNARVHTLHDPVRWKYHAIGNYYLNDENPPLRGPSDGQEKDPAQRVQHELHRAHQPRPVDPPAGHLDPIQDHRILDRTGAVAGTRAVRRLFIADIVGVYDVYQQSVDVTLKESIQLPVNDPLLLVSAMAAVTRNLGFGLTANLTYEPPYLFARRMSTLDHLSRGRVGWNIVTGYLDSAAKAMGLSEQVEHDRRYDQADEYLEVLYKLWEGSWENGAVLNDRAAHLRAAREGAQGRAQGRVLSGRGLPPLRAVAAAHAGAVPGRQFRSRLAVRRAPCRVRVHQRPEQTVDQSAGGQGPRQRRRSRAQPEDIKVFMGLNVIVGETEELAWNKHAEYLSYASAEAGVAHFSASTGIDFSEYASTNRSST
jgi:alkanesulfonate monooxygenase SsuD/methylene tetrahydromethanopterin reductase-like flavin-dependent oxidoreductase (luciferase family)